MEKNQLISDVRLLATDLDGTIIGDPAGEFSLYITFRNLLNTFKSNNDFWWVVCTGRSLPGYKRLTKPMMAMGNVPDFVITRHAFIMRWTGKYYTPHVFWNIGVLYHLLVHNLRIKSAFNKAYKTLISEIPRVRVLSKTKHRFILHFQTDELAEEAENICKRNIIFDECLTTIRKDKILTVGVMPFAKGLSLCELIYHLGITPDNVLAIGNGINDITMFHKNVAKYTGCPRNSIKEVMETVKMRGGHIAKNRSLAGVIEILEAYQNGNICSEILDFSEEKTPRPNSLAFPNLHPHRRKKRYTVLKVVILLYIVLLVFASFDLIPYISHFIVAPYQMIINTISKLL
jgi:hydroxymethylpyrimidine pyrophosphatase-like HAD family hydrolase